MSDLGARIADLSPEQRALLGRLVERERRSAPASSAGITPQSESQNVVMSFGQERLWLIDQLDRDSVAYNNLLPLRLYGALDEQRLAEALTGLLARHAVLRTRFALHDNSPRQWVEAQHPFDLPVVNLEELEAPSVDAAVMDLARQESGRVFDLRRAPLIRGRLLRISPSEHVLLLTLHHIATDEWSTDIIIREISLMYELGRSRSGGNALPELPVQYTDYAIWQRDRLAGARLDGLLEYWTDRMSGAPVLDLPTDRPRPAVQTYAGARSNHLVNGALSDRLRQVARGGGNSLFVFLLAAFVALMQRLAAQDDVVIGTPVANRPRSELHGLVGFFVNTLALRIQSERSTSFDKLLEIVNREVQGGLAHQDLPFEMLVDELDVERDLTRNPLFSIVFSVLNAPEALSASSERSIRFELVPVPLETSRFDLECNVLDTPSGLAVRLVYNTDLFNASTVERLLAQYERVLSAVVSNPAIAVGEIDLLGAQERHQLLEELAGPTVPYDRDGSVVSAFAAQVAQRPAALAVEYAGQSLSYAELDARSNQLAHWLRSRGVERGALVGVCVERSVELVVAILGVLKAGAGYVPLDADYPLERLSFMVTDTGVDRVLCTGPTREALSGLSAELVDLESLAPELASHSALAPVVAVSATDVAYVMYTSGSTGWPKGVVVQHRSILRLVQGANYVDLGPSQVTLQLAPVSFDASTLELWGSLLNGGELVLYGSGPLSLPELGDFLVSRGISVLWLTAALFNRMVDEQLSSLGQVRQVLAGGEALSLSHVNRYLEHLPAGHVLVNGYGPTENTTFTCCHVMSPEDAGLESVPIGRPVSNTQVYVLGEDRELLPVGVVGELYAGGDGVAQGYLNQAQLTDEKFVQVPAVNAGRLYRTGDRVRWRAEGVLEYVGRADRQVKLRGYRIEPGEIEHAASGYAGVREAVVVLREDEPGEKRLVGYVVADDEVSLTSLRRHLQDVLPAYMVPAVLLPLESLPLTAVGKVDRDALPAPEGERYSDAQYVAPRSELEGEIASIWSEVLGVDQVGVTDNFFDLGGNSMSLMRLHGILEEKLGSTLPVVDLFQFPSVRAQASHFTAPVDAAPSEGGDVPPDPVMERARLRRGAASKVRKRLGR